MTGNGLCFTSLNTDVMLPLWLFALLILGACCLLHFTCLNDKTPSRPANGKKIQPRRNSDFLSNWL